MRELDQKEHKAYNYAFGECPIESGHASTNRKLFRAGFIAGLDYAQRKLDAYAAFVAGKITLKELEEVLSA